MATPRLVTVATSLLAFCASANGAVSFSEDFSSNTAGPNLGLKGGSSANIDYSAGSARFTGTAPTGSERAYIGTSTNFNLAQDFTVEVQVTVPSAGGGNGVALFGFGSGAPGDSSAGDGGSSYYEPSAGPSAYIALIPDDFPDANANSEITYADFNAGNTGGTANTFYQSGGNDVVLGSGTHRVRMSYNASTSTLTFSYQEDGVGSFIDLGPAINIGDNGFDSTTGQIFMGGAGGVIYDNLNVTVIPEPGQAVMLAVVSAGVLLRRTRRA